MARNLGWREAIVEVLKNAKAPMHPTEIANAIAEHGLRDELGATPAATVGARIYTSIKSEADASPFVRTGPSRFMLRGSQWQRHRLLRGS